MDTPAACSRCGRGYVTLSRDRTPCMACRGPIRWLPETEAGLDDSPAARQRRLDLLRRHYARDSNKDALAEALEDTDA